MHVGEISCDVANASGCLLFHLGTVNVMVGWLTLLLHIQEILDSKLGLETGCPD
jgi:hypothetical protein